MKAKDYAEQWKTSGKTTEELMKITQSLIEEIPDLCEKRRAKSSTAMISVFREIDDKWKAFARCFPNEINVDGLRILLLKSSPRTKELHHLIWPGKTIPVE